MTGHIIPQAFLLVARPNVNVGLPLIQLSVKLPRDLSYMSKFGGFFLTKTSLKRSVVVIQ